MRFLYKNVTFKKNTRKSCVNVTGKITNISGKDFNAVLFRVVIFRKGDPIASIPLKINGFANGQTKTFDEPIDVLPERLIDAISRYDIFPEESY